MSLLRIIAKILLFPVVVSLTVIQWAVIFLNSVSEVILGTLSFIFVLTGMASLLFGPASAPQALKMIAAGFVLFLIPQIRNWVIERIICLRCILDAFFRV